MRTSDSGHPRFAIALLDSTDVPIAIDGPLTRLVRDLRSQARATTFTSAASHSALCSAPEANSNILLTFRLPQGWRNRDRPSIRGYMVSTETGRPVTDNRASSPAQEIPRTRNGSLRLPREPRVDGPNPAADQVSPFIRYQT